MYLFIPLSLSIIGTSVVMISFLLFRRRNESFHRYIFCLAASDWLFSSWWLVTTYLLSMKGTRFCIAQAFGLEFFYLLTWLYPILITLKIFVVNILEKEFNRDWIYHLVVWSIPTIVCITCTKLNYFGPSGLWCYFVNYEFQLIFGASLVGVAFIVELFVFIAVVYTQYRIKTDFDQVEKTRIRATLRLFVYLVVPVTTGVWAFADRLYPHIYGRDSPYWLELVHGITTGCQGFFNSLVYGWDYNYVWKKWMLLISYRRREYDPMMSNQSFGSMTINEGLLDPPVDFDPKIHYAQID